MAPARAEAVGQLAGAIVYQLGTVEPLNWPGGSPLFYSGETNYLTIALSNQGTTRAYAVSGWLTPKSASVSVTSSPAPLQFGDLAERGGTGCGTTVTAAAGLCNTSVMNFPVITAPAHFSDPHAQFTLSILDSRNLPPTVFTIEVPVYARPP